ncbi:FAD-dependent monooxygenase [Streptomyces sp. NPDC059165]|uniref:FAD-dependent monooxygenase n=1 Tax=Streptomyces sp. NPDC059165 TaxID=3346751 RepID=UPI003679D97E
MTDVLIVGAGPTGLTLACDLARRGTAVRIIDRRAAPHRESRGKGLHPRSLEVFEALGAAEPVLATGTVRLVLRKYFDGVHVKDTDPFGDDAPLPRSPYRSGVLIGQWQVEEILRRRLGGFGVAVEYGADLTALTQDTEGVNAVLADGRTLRTAHLVGCDGGRSTVRMVLGITFEGHTGPAPTMVCGDVEAPGLSREYWHQWFTSEREGMMLCPMPGTDSFQLQASPEHDDRGVCMTPSLEGFQRLFDRHARMPGIRLQQASWLSTWQVNVRLADRLRVGRVFLAGDAAHVHPIAGGLGMNTGIQDAFNLGWKLALALTGHAGQALLDTYEEERLPVAAATLDITTDRLLRVLEAVRQPGKGTETGLTPPLGTTYRWSSLARGDGTRTLRPGDRAPDALATDGSGRPVRLHELLAEPRFTLLGFGPAVATALRDVAASYGDVVSTHALHPAPARAGVAADEDASRVYGIDGKALVLVRPDMHVALVAPGDDPGPVRAYLDGLRG